MSLSFEQASSTFHRLLAFFPDAHGSLRLAFKALCSWQRQHVFGEGSPIPCEGVYAIASYLRSCGGQRGRGRVHPTHPGACQEPSYGKVVC